MTDPFDRRAWRSIQETAKQLALFQTQLRAMSPLLSSDLAPVVTLQNDMLRIQQNLSFVDKATEAASLTTIANSSAIHLAQVVQHLHLFTNAFNIDWLGTYLQHLQPELEREPDERETLEHPETDLLLPSTRERIIVASPCVVLLEKLRTAQISLHDLQWRQLEEIVAELLHQDGYDVQLGPGSKDDGVDILAVKEDPLLGFFVSVWQAKKLKEGNKVNIHVIRELAYTRLQKQATKGIIVTTTSLTRDALKLIQQERYHLHKVDGNDLDTWIRTGRHV